MLLSSTQALLESSSTGDCSRFDQPEAASVLSSVVVFEVADDDGGGGDGDDDDENCSRSSLNPPQRQQVDRRHSLHRGQGEEKEHSGKQMM